MQPKDSERPVFIAAEAGVAYQPGRSNDPMSDWMGLMEVVEALCPCWPEREPAMGMQFKL